jgi:glycosyltransferase involved in cell wall biosynthesis
MGTPVKVLQVGMTDNVGGMETYLIEQYRHINHSLLNYDFVNITADRDMVFRNEIVKKGNHVYDICRRSLNPIKHYWQWYKLLAAHKGEYDAITLNVCHLYYVFPLVIAKLMGVKRRIIHAHNAGDEIKVGFLRNLIVNLNRKLMSWAATDYWACSTEAGTWIFGNRKFKIIHNAIDVDKFRFNNKIRTTKLQELKLDKKFVIGHVGRFTYQKNHEFLINFFAKIVKKQNNAVLLLIGDAVNDDKYLNMAKKQVETLGIQNNVKFLGLRKDVPELMQAMDCFVLPSRFEGLPLVGLEAQAAGLKCYFADTITKELKITDLVEYLPLDNSDVWVNEVLQSQKNTHYDMKKQLTDNGYDINTEVKKVEDLYLK